VDQPQDHTIALKQRTLVLPDRLVQRRERRFGFGNPEGYRRHEIPSRRISSIRPGAARRKSTRSTSYGMGLSSISAASLPKKPVGSSSSGRMAMSISL